MRKVLALVLVLIGVSFLAAATWTAWQTAEWRESVCFGTTRSGSLAGAKRLPVGGRNFVAYSGILRAIGRASMHGAVRDTILDAYAELAETAPELTFIYGEASWPGGGRLYPHRTHRNGLSVDFFSPLRDMLDRPRILPATLLNAFGYGVHFDRSGEGHGWRIDFDAIAKHLDALQRAGAKRGVGIKLVILEPELQTKLFATPAGAALKGKLPFASFRAWVAHDNHYHVDFSVPCRGGA